MSVGARIFALAARAPERIAIVELPTGRTLSYGALAAGMRATAACLAARGIAPGERVATLGQSSAAFLVAELGTLASGCVRVPLDPSLTADEHAAQCRDAGARLVLHEPAQAARAALLAPQAIAVDTLDADGPAVPAPDDEALASLNYTGGTTGQPKAVMLTHAAFEAIHRTIAAHRPVRADDVFLNVRPLWPIAAVIATAHLYAGARVVLGGRFDPSRFARLLAEWRATSTSLVPTMLARVVDALGDAPPPAGLDLLRAIDIGGSALDPALGARAERLFGARLGVIYGLTEASWTCYRPPGAPYLAGAVGRPLGPNRVIVRDAGGAPVAPGVEGEVTITGPHLMSGYWRQPEATAAALGDGRLHTGDLGRIAPDGTLVVTGRLKDVIRSGAKSVIPAEVEAALAAHPTVAECAVVGVPDPAWGEVVAAAVVLAPGARADAQALAAHCAARLAGFKKPRRIVFVDALPRSHYGKVQRARVVALIQATPV